MDQLSTRPPSAGDYLSCTASNGNKFYFRMKNSCAGKDVIERGQYRNLLSVDILDLSRAADRIKANAIANKERQKQLSEDEMTFDPLLCTESSSLWVEKYAPKSFAQLLSPEHVNREVLKRVKLWDKFVFKRENPVFEKIDFFGNVLKKPSTFTTQDSVKLPQEDEVERDDDSSNENDESGEQKIHCSSIRQVDGGPVDHRPQPRVILLSGPPGTGKTTLAHIVAKHCGYRPFEVNASDDRTASVLKESILRCMSSNTIHCDKRPNCIILDEIDGVDGSDTIDMLVSMITAPIRNASPSSSSAGSGSLEDDDNTASKAATRKKGNSVEAQIRPLICICNDHFAPSLRELKKHAKLFVFQPPTELRLMQRLKQIAHVEGLRVSASALTALCHASGSDIRSSINTLQFAAAKVRTIVANGSMTNNSHSVDSSGALLSAIRSGIKDEQKDVFKLWKEVFNRKELKKSSQSLKSSLAMALPSMALQPQQQHETQDMAVDEDGTSARTGSGHKGNETNVEARGSAVGDDVEMLIRSAQDFGDYYVLLDGLHENYAGMRYPDPDFLKTSSASDWLSEADMIDRFTRVNPGGFQVQQYMAVAVAGVHHYCAQDSAVKLTWPKQEKQASYKRLQRENILRTFQFGVPAAQLRSIGNTSAIALDMISPLLDIISPLFRGQSYAACTPTEKHLIQGVAKVMAAYGLQYQLTASLQSSWKSHRKGQPFASETLQLSPPLAELVNYSMGNEEHSPAIPGRKTEKSHAEDWAVLCKARRPVLSEDLREAINSELRRILISSDDKKDNPQEKQASMFSQQRPLQQPPPQQKPVMDVLKEDSKKKGIYSGRLDMFCTVKAKTNSTLNQTELGPSVQAALEKKRKIHYKFNQGFSNAVKRPVNIKEFL